MDIHEILTELPNLETVPPSEELARIDIILEALGARVLEAADRLYPGVEKAVRDLMARQKKLMSMKDARA